MLTEFKLHGCLIDLYFQKNRELRELVTHPRLRHETGAVACGDTYNNDVLKDYESSNTVSNFHVFIEWYI